MEKERIAVFDFDGTITTKDTLFDFLIFTFGYIRFIKGFTISFPKMMAYKLHFTSNHITKEYFIAQFLKGMENDNFNELCRIYCNHRLPFILNKLVMDKIQWHKNNNDKILIVSASIFDWIIPWATAYGFQSVIATELERINNILTGKFSTKNCSGKEKVNRLLKEYPDRDSYILYAYGNSHGDMELIDFADSGWYKNKYIKKI
jgi:HAD superfamily hydrolase (TIGR01490 family)